MINNNRIYYKPQLVMPCNFQTFYDAVSEFGRILKLPCVLLLFISHQSSPVNETFGLTEQKLKLPKRAFLVIEHGTG